MINDHASMGFNRRNGIAAEKIRGSSKMGAFYRDWHNLYVCHLGYADRLLGSLVPISASLHVLWYTSLNHASDDTSYHCLMKSPDFF